MLSLGHYFVLLRHSQGHRQRSVPPLVLVHGPLLAAQLRISSDLSQMELHEIAHCEAESTSQRGVAQATVSGFYSRSRS